MSPQSAITQLVRVSTSGVETGLVRLTSDSRVVGGAIGSHFIVEVDLGTGLTDRFETSDLMAATQKNFDWIEQLKAEGYAEVEAK